MKINNLKWLRYALMYIVIWCISPPLSYGLIYRVLAIVAMGYTIRYHCVINRLKVEKHFIATVFLVIYMLILSVATGDGIGFRIGVYIFLCIMLSSEIFTNDEIDKKNFYFIIFATFLLYVVWNICSLRGIAETPNIMRLLSKNSNFSESYAKQGVGGYGYIYTVITLLPVGIDCLLNRKIDMKYRLAASAFVATTYILVFQSQYFLAIILSILLIGIYFSLKVHDKVARVCLIIVLFIVFIVAYVNADRILLYLIDKNDFRSIELKLNSMYDLLVNDGEIENSEFSVRFGRYMEDIRYTIQHPIFGGFKYSITGNHSHILDYIAQYGIPLGVLHMAIILKPLRRLQLVDYTAGYSSLFVFMTIALLNTISHSFASVLYIILPLYYHMLKEREGHG